MTQRYRWDWVNRERATGGECVIYDRGEKVATAIGPAVAERLVQALNHSDMAPDTARKIMQQELVREQATRDSGAGDMPEGAPV